MVTGIVYPILSASPSKNLSLAFFPNARACFYGLAVLSIGAL